MIKIDDNCPCNLDDLALEHYNRLIGVPLRDGVNYHATQSLIGRVNKQKSIDGPKGIRASFWKYLTNKNNETLKKVITGRPNDLRKIAHTINSVFGNVFTERIRGRVQSNEFGTIVKKVFNYTAYRDNPACCENCSKFNILYCPYCNEQVVQVISTKDLRGNEKKKALFQLDHFYSQVKYPYLGISFFNLIPDCSVCNASLKLDKEFDISTHFNPFYNSFDEYFEFLCGNIIINSEDDFEITYKNKLPFSTQSICDFKIIERYRSHRRVIYKMYETFKNRSPKINTSLLKQIPGLFTDYQEETKILLSNYNVPIKSSEINMVQLGKLKRDIAKQLQIL